jgi:hypothetical protein
VFSTRRDSRARDSADPGPRGHRHAAAALVLDPTPALERIDPSAGWASDDARVVPDLTCYASAIRVAGRIEAVLQISTTRSRPADRFATLIRSGADRIATQLPSSYQR